MGWLFEFWVRVDSDPWISSSTRLRPIFRRVFSLLPVAFPLPISVLFLPFPLYLSSFFLFWEFCGLKVPKTTDLRTIRKTQFSDLGYRRLRLRKSTKRTLSYCAFVRDPSRGGNRSFGVDLRVVWGLVGETGHSRTFVRNLSLSLSLSRNFLSFLPLQVF